MPRWTIVLAILAALFAPSVLAHVPGGDGDPPDPPPDDDDDDGDSEYDDLPWWSSWEGEHWYGNVVPLHATTQVMYHMRATEDWVVWEEGGDIFALHVHTSTVLNVTRDDLQQTRPSIHGSRLVYEQWEGAQSDVVEHDLATGETRVIAGGDWNERSPVVRGQWVVWYDDRAGEWEIWGASLDSPDQIPVAISDVKKQDLVLLGDGVVAWRQIEYNQWDIYVRRLPDGPIRALTRDRSLEQAPLTDGRYVYFVKVPTGQKDHHLHRWDPESGDLVIVGKKGVTTNPIAFLPGGVEVTYVSGGPGLNTFLAINRSADRLVPIAPHFPATVPVAAGDLLFLTGRNETHNVVLRASISPFAVQPLPEVKIARPLDGSVILGPFLANGTYTPRGGWPEPAHLEWRIGGFGVTGSWEPFEATDDWQASIKPGNLTTGTPFRLYVRAVFDGAPAVTADVGLTYRVVNPQTRDLEDDVDISLASILSRNPGLVPLLLLVVLVVVLVVLRWRLRRVPRGAPRVEYVRPGP